MKNKLQKCRVSNLKSITAIVFLMFAVFNSSQQMFAQFTDDFTDGDFVSDPSWSGNDSKFTIESTRLSLAAPAAIDNAYLATSSKSINDATWEFLIQLDFNPSTSNFARVYLVSDQADLTAALNGYFVQLGNTADDVSLYRQDGTTITQIIDGTDGKTDLAEVQIRIRVTRNNDGEWQLFADPALSGTYVSEGSVSDQRHVTAMFFGVLCNYTSTRSDNFHFDDFSVSGQPISDLVPPDLITVKVISPEKLQLTFSEEVTTNVAIDPVHYFVDGIGNPLSAAVEDSHIVELTFEEKFFGDVLYVLRVSGIRDKTGNIMIAAEMNFRVASSGLAEFKDIIFSEIFADPSPSNSLPDIEFVELFNRSPKTINLEQWSLRDASSKINLPGIEIDVGEYLIITSNLSLFPAGIKSIALNDFPSLNNSGDNLVLADASGKIIDSLQYSVDWYKDDEKKEGGWSLELIDPDNDCAGAENWIASEHPSGGTPGVQNSVRASKPDLNGPVLLSVIPVSPTIIRIIFNEKLQREVPSSENFAFEPSVSVGHISFDGPSHAVLLLELTNELSNGTTYSIIVTSIADCTGNQISDTSNYFTFGLPEDPLSSDVLINEILFDPRPGGVDFVEIVNVSKKFFNLKNWTIGNFDNNTITQSLLISRIDLLIPPGGYLAFTEDVDALKGDYPSSSEPNLFEVEKLPAFNDDAGSVALSDANGLLVDFFNYSNSFHSVFINDTEGVSLERLAFEHPTNEVQNWKSASTMSGYATPGYINSNSRADPVWTNSVQIEPEVFVPIYGQPDFVLIHYDFGKGGNVANVKVLDANGHHVKQLANNEILGTSGVFRWDGDKDDGTKTRMGYYMVWFEVFDDRGEVRTIYKRVVVATRF